MGPRRRQRNESGSALIIALFFATIFSLLVVSVISFTDAGLKATGAFVDQGKTASAASGAVDTAIKRFSMAGPCGDYAAPAINNQATIVHCDDLKAPADIAETQPQNALLSLGASSSESGIHATSNMQVQGDVFSNSTIDAGAGSTMTVSGDVSAVGNCSGVAQAALAPSQPAYVKDCANSAPAADPVIGADPDYPAPTTAVPVRQTVPGCTPPPSPAWLVTLAPGYYDDAGALSELTNGTSCHGANIVVWLQPGIYYFDFTFRGPSAV